MSPDGLLPTYGSFSFSSYPYHVPLGGAERCIAADGGTGRAGYSTAEQAWFFNLCDVS